MSGSVEENLVIYSAVDGIYKRELMKVVSPRKAIPKLKFTFQTLCALMMKMKMFFGGFLNRKYVFLSKVFSFSVMTFVGCQGWEVECKYYFSSSLQLSNGSHVRPQQTCMLNLISWATFTLIPLNIFTFFLVWLAFNWIEIIWLRCLFAFLEGVVNKLALRKG